MAGLQPVSRRIFVRAPKNLQITEFAETGGSPKWHVISGNPKKRNPEISLITCFCMHHEQVDPPSFFGQEKSLQPNSNRSSFIQK